MRTPRSRIEADRDVVNLKNGSAYGKRSGLFAGVLRRPPRASFLGSAFAAYRQYSLFFAGVAVRVAVQANAV
jgi:hypothetical protein